MLKTNNASSIVDGASLKGRKMKIKSLVNMRQNGKRVEVGEVVEVSEEDGKYAIGIGKAVEFTEEKPKRTRKKKAD